MRSAATALGAAGFGTLSDLVAALRDGDAPAASEGARRLSRGALFTAAARFAGGLVTAGVTPGDRVALAAPSGIGWLVAFLGAACCGAVPVLIDPRLAPADLAAIVVHAEPRLVVADPALDLPDGVDRVALLPPDDRAPAVGPRAAGGGAAPAVILYTSGTSGQPKGVVLSHAALSAQAAGALSTPYGRELMRRQIFVLPLNFSLALNTALATLQNGGELVFCPSLMPADILDLQQRVAATGMVAVPRLLETMERWLAGERRKTVFDGAVFAVVCGGAPLDADLRVRLAQLGLRVFPGYGMAEAGPTIAASTPDALRPGTVGRPYPGVEVAIEEASDEILVRSSSLMLGYFRNPEVTAAVLRDGWLRTGDCGRLDADGFLTITGRLKDLIVLSSGKKVVPEKVETAVAASAGLAECCLLEVNGVLTLVAVPRRGEAPAGDLEQRLRAAFRQLAPHERPTALRFRTAPLPRTATGKLQRWAAGVQLHATPMLETTS